MVIAMSITVRLREDLKAAMKSKDEVRKSVIRLALAGLKNAELEKGSPLSDMEEIDVMARQAKMRRDSIAEYEKVGRLDAADAEQAEMEIIMGYLPQQVSEAEIRQIISEAIAATGAEEPRDIGKVMGVVMPKLRGRADGKLVNSMAREMLDSPKDTM
jgi:uncharacterized protein YqeY